MKKFIYSFCIFACAGVLSSCDKDEEEKDSSKKNLDYAFSEGTFSSDKTIYEYDSKGRLTTMYKNSYNDKRAVFSYNGSTINNVINEYDSMTGTLNSKGYITSCIHTSKYSNGEHITSYTYTYDEKGHCIQLHSDDKKSTIFEIQNGNFNETTVKYTWENDNIVKIETTNLDHVWGPVNSTNYLKYTNEDVTSPIENKTGARFNSSHIVGIEDDIAMRNLYGVGSKNLPVSIVGDDYETKLTWTLDVDGYPTSVTDGSTTTYFVWE